MRDDTAIPLPLQSPVGVRAGALSARAALGDAPAGGPVRSLYIHIPFCFHKCHYCDFYSIVDTRDRQAAFTARLCQELEALAPWAAGAPLSTIFVGGGTPSLLRVPLWQDLLACLDRHYDLSWHRAPARCGLGREAPADLLIGQEPDATVEATGEFTVECNPETVTPELMDVLAAGGVGRVSIGAQSFRREHLKTLERWHEPENVAKAVEMARGAGIDRQSIDLIFGVPGQTLEQWRDDLDRAIALGTEHISCYDLTYEPGTAMTKRLQLGQFTPADEETEVEMFRATVATLRAAGLERYEVSNYARPGAECRHNLAYWRQEQWLAAGPSASAHVAGHRWKNVARLDDYLHGSDGGFAPITDHETPDARRALAERVMTGLRLAEGLDAASIKEQAGPPAADRLHRLTGDFLRRGLLQADPKSAIPARWVLTEEGFLFADGIAADLMAALVASGSCPMVLRNRAQTEP